MSNFGKRLKFLRKSKGLSQEDLALEINVSRSLIAKYESGLGLPSEEILSLICDYFSVDKKYFIVDSKIKVHEHYILYRNLLMTLISSFFLIIYIYGGYSRLDPVIMDEQCFIKTIFNSGFLINSFSFLFIIILIIYTIYTYILLFNRSLFTRWYFLVFFQICYVIATIYFFFVAINLGKLFIGIIILIPQIIFSIFILISMIKCIMKIMILKVTISLNK